LVPGTPRRWLCASPPGCSRRSSVTNLYNLVQPIIRLEVSDILTLESELCRCGRTLVRARAIEGRSDDVLRLPGQKGGEVAVHPIEFGIVTRDRDVREYQVLQEGSFLRILVVPRREAGGGLETRLRHAVSRRLAELGVEEPQVTVERREELARSSDGKLQMVVANPAREKSFN
jgi:phenylacetate-CoA ligase